MARWIRRAIEKHRQVRYDAYPDHDLPFEGNSEPEAAGPPPPVDPVVEERLPNPAKGPPIRVVVFRGRQGRAVNIEPFRWDRPDLWPRSFLWTIGNAVAATIERLRKEDDGQGMAEYALILALIAVASIVVLLFLGGQISAILAQLGNSI